MEQSVSSAIDVFSKQLLESDDAGWIELIKEIKSIVLRSIKDGVVDGAAMVSFDGGLNLVTASQVGDGQAVAAKLEKGMSAVTGKVKPEVKFNAYSHQGAQVHLGTIKLPAEADEAVRKILSDPVKFALATSSKSVWVAVGSAAEAN